MTETDTTLLNGIAQLPLDLNSATNGLIEIADRLMTAAIADRNATERRHYTMVKKLMASPTNKRWATQVTDRLFRTTDATRTRKAIAQITQSTGYPSFLSAKHHAGLRLLKCRPTSD